MRDDYLLTTERLGLRRWAPPDTAPFAEMNADKEVMRFFPAPLSLNETKNFIERIEKHFDKHGFGLYAVDVLSNKEFIGMIGFQNFDFKTNFSPGTEIGWRLRRESWGKGYATEGAKECLRYGFEDLKFNKIFSFTATINLPSIAVMKRIGLTYVKDFGHPKLDPRHELFTHVLYSISRGEYSERVVFSKNS